MLSSQAWNAFLKTLEEPPPHTIFVLATTEAHKVLPTVVDRCHRFDFDRPTVEQIATVLRARRRRRRRSRSRRARSRCSRASDRLLPRRARHARAARHLLRRRAIAPEDVLAVLGVADAELLFGAVDAVAAGDPRRALRAPRRAAPSRAATRASSCSDLEAHARELLSCRRSARSPPSCALTPERDARLAEQARRCPAPTSCACSTCSPQALEAPAKAAPTRAPSSSSRSSRRRRRRSTRRRARCWRGSSASRGGSACWRRGRRRRAPRAVPARPAADRGRARRAPAARHPSREPGARGRPLPQRRPRPSGGREPVRRGASPATLATSSSWPAVVELVEARTRCSPRPRPRARPVAVGDAS